MGLVDQSCKFSPHSPARQSRHHLQVPGRATLRPVCPGSWKTVNTTERPCQGLSLGLFVQKTNQQHSWKTPRYSFQALSKLPALIITLLLYYLGSAEGVSTLDRGAGAANSPCQKLTALPVCNFSLSLISLSLCSLSASTSSISLHIMTDTQGSGAGEEQVGDAAASVKEGNLWKIENK